MTATCEHGVSLYAACEACGRHDDGSDGSSAGEYRARMKRWRAALAGELAEWQGWEADARAAAEG